MTACIYPTEWHRQDRAVMAFPRADRRKEYETLLAPFVRIASSIAWQQPLLLLCHDPDEVKSLFCDVRNITFLQADYPGPDIAKYGPIGVYEADERIWLLPSFAPPIIQELIDKGYLYGRSRRIENLPARAKIDTDGEGLTLLYEEAGDFPCARSPLRVAPLPGYPDIPPLRLLPDGAFAYLACEDSDHPLYEPLQRLRRDTVEPLRQKGLKAVAFTLSFADRLPAFATDFLVTNRALLFPSAHREDTEKKIEIFKALFPGRDIIPLRLEALYKKGLCLRTTVLPAPAFMRG